MSCLHAMFLFSMYLGANSVPPDACFANFRWDDCGSPPVRVLYYWKPGSRCEVGVWRGCLPNMNMFKDEYECVATCIFATRAEASDYHELSGIEKIENATVAENETPVDDTTQMVPEDRNTTESTDRTGETSPGDFTADQNEVDATMPPKNDDVEGEKLDTDKKAGNETQIGEDKKTDDKQDSGGNKTEAI